MSYTIDLNAKPCSECDETREPEWTECPEPTYNLTPIFDFALTGDREIPSPDVAEVATVLFGAKTDRPRGLRLLDGRQAHDTVADLDAAMTRLSDPANQEHLEGLEPDNGWGDLGIAVTVIRRLRRLAKDYPECIWSVC